MNLVSEGVLKDARWASFDGALWTVVEVEATHVVLTDAGERQSIKVSLYELTRGQVWSPMPKHHTSPCVACKGSGRDGEHEKCMPCEGDGTTVWSWSPMMSEDMQECMRCGKVANVDDWSDGDGHYVCLPCARAWHREVCGCATWGWIDMERAPESEPVHAWFGLTYAEYLTVPRLALTSMPVDWQARFVEALRELDDRLDWRPKEGRYWVELRDDAGRMSRDPLRDYKHGKPLPDRTRGEPT